MDGQLDYFHFLMSEERIICKTAIKEFCLFYQYDCTLFRTATIVGHVPRKVARYLCVLNLGELLVMGLNSGINRGNRVIKCTIFRETHGSNKYKI